jgi:quercetin dioxygenase-like cupin family protein
MKDDSRGARSASGVLPFPQVRKPAPKVSLWEERRRPEENQLREQLAAGGYQVLKWTSEPGQAYLPHAHIYPELLWVLTGSVTVILTAERRMLELFPGDRLETPAGMLHALLAGPDGAEYLIATHLEDETLNR